jgi:hypothetical protein
MRRHEFIALAGAVAGTWSLRAMAQDRGSTFYLGVLWPLPPQGGIAHALFGELRRRGFMTLLQEGQQALCFSCQLNLSGLKRQPDKATVYKAICLALSPDRQ